MIWSVVAALLLVLVTTSTNGVLMYFANIEFYRESHNP
jgi:hypothetical protein